MTMFIMVADVALLWLVIAYLLNEKHKSDNLIQDMQEDARTMQNCIMRLEHRMHMAEGMLAVKKHLHTAPCKRAKNKNASRRRRRRRR